MSTPEQDQPDPPVLPLTEVARRIGISRSTAYALVKADEFPIPVLRPSPRRMFCSTAAVNDYINGTAA